MASTIAAVTTGGGGVITTADSSGNLSLLSGATTVVAVTSTGVAVTGTLSATGASTFTGTGKFATTIGVGNATPSASGSGITFPATQSASSDANTLDDYEEGTFTPKLNGFTTVGLTTNTGSYIKIGRLVYINIIINATSFAGAGGGVSYFTNMPFASTLANQSNFSMSKPDNIANQNSGSNLSIAGQLYTATFPATANFAIAGTYQA